VESVSGYSYQIFIYPGDNGHDVLFTSLFTGCILSGQELDFLKEVLVRPISRASVLRKDAGRATDAMVQVDISHNNRIFHKHSFTPLVIIEAFIMLLLISIAMVSIGLVIGPISRAPRVSVS